MYHETFTMLAGYNAWANRRLYETVAALADPDRKADRGLFFRSLHGTLNHILVADRIWMKRFTGEGEAPSRLDAILHEDFPSLRTAREGEDRRIAGWIGSLGEEAFSREITYHPSSHPGGITQRIGPTLLHVFNHQTHHRGQCHAALTGLGVEVPSLDLALFQRGTG